MKENTFLKIVVVALLGINIAVISFLLIGRKHHHKQRGPAAHIIEKLQLNKPQQEQYQLLIKDHRKNIDKYDSINITLKADLYRLSLNANPDSAGIEAILKAIGQNQISIERTHAQHLESIKKICSSDQKKNFDMLIEEFPKLFSRRPPHHENKHPH